MIDKYVSLDDLTEDQFQIGRVLWEHEVDTEYKDSSDEEVRDNVLDTHFAVEFKPQEIREVLTFIDEREKDVKYYDGYLELDDAHVYNNIRTKNDVPEEAYDSFQQYIDTVMGDCIAEFEHGTDEKLLFLGRSGRHACIEANWNNFVNYLFLQKTYLDIQEEMYKKIYEGWSYK